MDVIYKLHRRHGSAQATATFRKWERELKDEKVRAIIAARLFRLANGLAGDVSPVGNGVSELRIHYGPGYRVYFQRRGEQMIVLLCGGDKGMQARDIQQARVWQKSGMNDGEGTLRLRSR